MLSVDLLRRKRLFNSWIYLTFNISIPVESGSRSFVELIGDSLEKIQYRFNKVLVVIIDEYSMWEILMTQTSSHIGVTFEEDFKDAVRLFTENAEVDRYNAEKMNKIGTLSRTLWHLIVRHEERRRANKWMQGRGSRNHL
uniref:Uncharacterized protein n=1 Tax=Hyaloperonospora arabidopsidis (strain Emoy2) TaxID=559515 RepID=M4C280_HYAAE